MLQPVNTAALLTTRHQRSQRFANRMEQRLQAVQKFITAHVTDNWAPSLS